MKGKKRAIITSQEESSKKPNGRRGRERRRKRRRKVSFTIILPHSLRGEVKAGVRSEKCELNIRLGGGYSHAQIRRHTYTTHTRKKKLPNQMK